MSNYSRMYKIGDMFGATNIGGIALDESKNILYGIKSKKNNQNQYLFSINNYSKPKMKDKTTVQTTNNYNYTELGHANGLTYDGKFLYVATVKKGIFKIDVNGNKDSKGRFKINKIMYKNMTGNGVSSIAHVKDNMFVIYDKGKEDFNRKYSLVKMNPRDNQMKFIRYIDIYIPKNIINSYGKVTPIYQDIYSKNNNLYIIVAIERKINGKKEYNNSLIFTFDINTGKLRSYDSFANKKANKKFEIEGLLINSKNTLIFSTNEEDCDSLNKVKNWI